MKEPKIRNKDAGRKLRNKKTGEIGNLIGTERSCPYITIDIDFHDGNPRAFDYTSLTELNEDWEDYEPVEPLIKDEKIRKAVRAWADINAIDDATYGQDKGGSWFYFEVLDENNKRKVATQIRFRNVWALSKSESWKWHPIAELCGEEEE